MGQSSWFKWFIPEADSSRYVMYGTHVSCVRLNNSVRTHSMKTRLSYAAHCRGTCMHVVARWTRDERGRGEAAMQSLVPFQVRVG